MKGPSIQSSSCVVAHSNFVFSFYFMRKQNLYIKFIQKPTANIINTQMKIPIYLSHMHTHTHLQILIYMYTNHTRIQCLQITHTYMQTHTSIHVCIRRQIIATQILKGMYNCTQTHIPCYHCSNEFFSSSK